MPRSPREELAGGVFHVYARGNNRRPIYFDRRDRRTYLALLAATVARTGWRCMSYCLMDNHVHLLIETPRPNLGEGMQRLHGAYAQLLNRRHRQSGHVFQGRYGAVPVKTDGQLWLAARYVALNPVQAGLSIRAEDYEWSSHAAVLRGGGPRFLDIDRLMSYFEGSGANPRARYLNFVDGLA